MFQNFRRHRFIEILRRTRRAKRIANFNILPYIEWKLRWNRYESKALAPKFSVYKQRFYVKSQFGRRKNEIRIV